MKVLQNDYILKSLDLPTVEWKQYFPDTTFAQNILWSIKIEEIPLKTPEKNAELKIKKSPLHFLKDRRCINHQKTNALIGVDAASAKKFGEKKRKQINSNTHAIIYYPYYTVVKSGILDINRDRIVIEGTKGDISNMVTHNHIEVTMIFQSDDLEIMGDEKFFTQEEVLPLIDYGREIKKMATKDLEGNKNIQLYFSYVYQTSEVLKPEGERRLIFYKFKLF